jgi:CDP-diacylglycerol--serine O-phosphatidyltransferase
MARARIKRKVTFLPNLLTAGNLFAGFYAIIASVNFEFERAGVALIVAGILDVLDGKVARFTGSTSRFGVEFDSLADLVSFGVAPALLIYLWALQPYGRIGWVAAFLMVACGALRLARFNVQAAGGPSRWFTGLPIPASASSIATTVLLLEMIDLRHPYLGPALIFQVYLLAFLMVSSIRYRSFKDLGIRSHHSFPFLVSTIILLSIIALHPQVALFSIAAAYVLSGPSGHLVSLVRKQSPDPSVQKPEGKTNA